MAESKVDFEAEFEKARKGLAAVYNQLSRLLSEGKDGPDGPFPGHTPWDVLYGHGTREALRKITEADMWLDRERMSVG